MLAGPEGRAVGESGEPDKASTLAVTGTGGPVKQRNVTQLEGANAHLGGGAGDAELEHVLHDVVAKGVLAENERVGGDLRDKPVALRLRGVVHAPLHHAAPVPVGGDLHAVRARRVVDELRVLRAQPLQAPLHHVVAVQILDERHHPRAESGGGERRLLRQTQRLHQLLDGARAVRVERHPHHLRQPRPGHQRLRHRVPLVWWGALQHRLRPTSST
eukprot:487368-Prorocentrum_minimum.AAC.4